MAPLTSDANRPVNRGCRLCGKTTDLFSLKLTDESDEPYSLPVCGTCWDIVVQLSRIAIKPMLDEMEKRIAAHPPEESDAHT